ncbi:hypothetical protein COT49_01100 [candidate division WWE3 bacterium CG08_land_8_20_14_0_20_40_13]|uniref:Lipid II flippase n=1 Tax=candidate division WWE3 bacterium CG08_land_8_20_14_0_20_40_13 TaxID=1975084 RepID=A0A2H0XEN6_UNCKA|nr:MAG: hypothetical protein COT49_01100 [candidate division WWE3 bacterium CG08_land_8_20_14_0_20_40_13]
MIKERSLFSDSVTTTIASFGAQFLTFVISAFIAAQYGATSKTDAFFYALSAVVVVNAAVSGVLKSVFTSVFLRFVHKEKQNDKEILASFYLYFLIFLFAVWSLFNVSSYLVTIYVAVPGIPDRELLFRVAFQLSFMIIFNGLVECFSTVYNTYQKFIVPILTPILRSFFFIGFVWLTLENIGVESLSIGNSLAEFFHMILLFIILKTRGSYFGLSLNLHPAVRKMMTISLPSFLSNATTRINEFIDASFVAPVIIGGVTIVNYANKISSIPAILLSGGFLTVILTHWSLKKNVDGEDSLKDSVLNSLLAIGTIFIPVLVIMFVLREPLVKLMYERKNFTPELTYKTAMLVGLYLFGLLPLMLGRILTRAFLTLEDTWTPFWVGNIRAVVNVCFNFILIGLFGYIGVAISTSLTSLLLFSFMIIKLRTRLRIIFNKNYLLEWGKIFLSGLITGIAIYELKKLLFDGFVGIVVLGIVEEITAIGSISVTGLLIYLMICYFFKAQKLFELLKLIKKG